MIILKWILNERYLRMLTELLSIKTVHGVVGITTRYGLDSLEFESQRGRGLTGTGAHPASYAKVIGPFSELKWPGCDADCSSLSSAEVKERV